MMEEIERVRAAGVAVTPDNLCIADNAALVLPIHRQLDKRWRTRAVPGASAPQVAASVRRMRIRSRAGPCAYATCPSRASCPAGSIRC